MDFRNICQKFDVDSIRAKLPPLPGLPTLPQIKLPKSVSKLKSRKIFRSSKEDINRNSPDKAIQQQSLDIQHTKQQQLTMPPAGFIKHTPTRISTISSLMNQDSGEESTYRSACSIEDDYPPISGYYGHSSAIRQPMSPACVSATATGIDNKNGSTTRLRMSISERLHQSYKDLSDFRLKHIFAKKTIVRRDSIQVQHYVTRYEEDLRREAEEQEQRDHAIAENYKFRFKISHQNTDHSNSITPDDSPRSEPIMGRSTGRTVGELSGDESGMESSPPVRKPGIASSRFARVRNPPLRFSSSEQEEEKIIYPQPNSSALWSIQKQKQQEQQQISNESSTTERQSATTKSKFGYKESVRRLKSYISTPEDHDTPEELDEGGARGSAKMLAKLKGLSKRSDTETSKEVKRKHNSSPRSSDEEISKLEAQNASSPNNSALNAVKHNFRRFQQSMKSRSQHATTTDESGDDSTVRKSSTETKVDKLTSRLRRFRSRDVSVEDLDGEGEIPTGVKQAASQSPIRQVISNKLETWKKSFKKKQNKEVEGQTSDGETSPEKEKPIGHKRSDTLMKKLKQIRARKSTTSKEDLDGNTEVEGTDETQKSKSKVTKFTEARQRTFKKVNERMQNMKFFHRSQEQHEPQTVTNKDKYNSEEEDLDESPKLENELSKSNLPATITRRDFPPSEERSSIRKSLEREGFEQFPISTGTIHIPTARAAWSTKPYLSQSMESDIDPSELPRVLIHQDNSDNFESTLIIAVTRPILSTSPIITEIPLEEQVPTVPKKLESNNQGDWVPNRKIIEDFLGTTAPSGSRKQSFERTLSGHKRKLSMDSSSNSDSDSWMSESRGPMATTSRRTSQSGLGSIDEQNEAWKVKSKSDEVTQPLYKAKSIDIFEKNVLKGGVLTAFEDFDEELRNEPVMKIATVRNADSCERDSSEDTADEDDSSRITKISVDRLREGSADSVKVIANNKEALRGKTLLQYGNSRESLIANFDENEEKHINSKRKHQHDDDDDDKSEDDDRPPSAAPSPPPKMSPPPPPLPQRQPSIRISKRPSETPPPLPKSKPPLKPPPILRKQVPPPRIPERSASMARAPKPLVKTSSLRLVYSEQLKPADVGKVNKLISRFEPTDGHITQRPRVISRRLPQEDSEDFSDDEEDYATMADKLKERYANIKIERDTTPTPTNTPIQGTPEAKQPIQEACFCSESQDLQIRIKREMIIPMVVTTTDEDNNVQVLTQPVELKPTLDIPLDVNFNTSRPNSEYGSPLEYPSSLTSSLETIPIIERKDTSGQRLRSVDRPSARSRRSMTRDDDNFYSFDSDEENSYYSISSTGSNRYIVEL